MSAVRGIALTLFLLLTLPTFSPAQRAHRGGRYDEGIRTAVARLLAGKSDYKDVKAEVGDSVVTLTGSVELASTRKFLVRKVRDIAHVNSVRNEIALDPPAENDSAVLGRVQQRLEDAGLKGITLRVREGAVIVEGMVRNTRDRERALQMVRETAGVKEVESRLTVAEE
ncbi:MAG: BON domain-containing protein [Terriglobales bacterium]